jgi:hypothetical protein
MGFDGFVINRHLPHQLICDEETISIACDAILSAAANSDEQFHFPARSG